MRALWRNIISSSIWVLVAVLLNLLMICRPLMEGGLEFNFKNLGYVLMNAKNIKGHPMIIGFVPLFFLSMGAASYWFFKRTILPLFELFVLKQVIERKMKLPPRRCEKTHIYLPHWNSIETVLKIPNEKGAFFYPFPIDPDWDRQRVCIRYLRRSHLVLSILLADDLNERQKGDTK